MMQYTSYNANTIKLIDGWIVPFPLILKAEIIYHFDIVILNSNASCSTGSH